MIMITNCQDNVSHLKKIFSKVFSKNDPFDKMFVPSISSKILLYPTNGYHLSEKQFLALTTTMKILGEPSFYLSEIEGNPFEKINTHSIHTYQHFEVNIETSYVEYERKNIVLENALYSAQGEWGIIISHEEHAVLGGHKQFIDTFKKLYPDFINDQAKFIKTIEYWSERSKTNMRWLPEFMKYINE